MSIIVRFFAALDDTSAALALSSGPGPAFESLSFGNFDPEEAVMEWECRLAGGSFEELVEASEPRIVAGQDNDGGFVFALSRRPGHPDLLQDRLELGAVRPPTWSDDQRQRAAAAVRAQVKLPGEPAPRAAQALTSRTTSTRRARRL